MPLVPYENAAFAAKRSSKHSKQRVSHRIGKIWAKIPGFFTDSTDSDLYVEGRSEQASPPGDQSQPGVGPNASRLRA